MKLPVLWQSLSLSSKMWPAWRDVSKKACGVWGHAYKKKNSHKSKGSCQVLGYVHETGHLSRRQSSV